MERIARDLVEARRSNALASSFDIAGELGVIDAYAIQAAAIRMVDDGVCGWKVGRLPEPTRGPGSSTRFIGPILGTTIRRQRGAIQLFAVSPDRPGAIEAEFLIRLRSRLDDVPSERDDDFWLSRIAAIHVGVELAGNDLSSMARAAPNVQIAAFGNNRGLIVGERIGPERWFEPIGVRTIVKGETVGVAESVVPWSTSVHSLTDAWKEAAALGVLLEQGIWIATGALTGIHAIAPEQELIVAFEGYESIRMTTFDTRNSPRASSRP